MIIFDFLVIIKVYLPFVLLELIELVNQVNLTWCKSTDLTFQYFDKNIFCILQYLYVRKQRGSYVSNQ